MTRQGSNQSMLSWVVTDTPPPPLRDHVHKALALAVGELSKRKRERMMSWVSGGLIVYYQRWCPDRV